ncbi:multiubiquitin domain-containing protein [Nocardioides lijunqiniae]|uniref:multiubiquitin domain-containing protein n=1 Tax=Nocardioides lijunqiniae TaxID=2760832 RepID=UPI001878A2B2|nr:multiubiquitin domain-containing protein [Nocardioides lijunqiniae]
MNDNDNTEQNGRSVSTENAKDQKPGKVPIYIDGTKYHPEGSKLTGAQLRTVPSPPVSSDRDLWLDIIDELDKLIEDDEVVELEKNMRFFTVPRVINPGQVIEPHSGT